MKKILYAVFVFFVTALMAGCESMDMTPLAQGNTESWFSTETELQMAVNDFYAMGYWSEGVEEAEQWTDNFTYRNQNRSPQHNGTVLDGTLNGQTEEVVAIWKMAYRLIARANMFLEKAHRATETGHISTEQFHRYCGEAYFVRACKYADLVFFFGDVPFFTTNITIAEAEAQGRTEKSKIVKQIYEDFDKAIEYLPASYGSKAEHATKGAAYAMKARFALRMGDFEKCAEAAKGCMDLGVYSLEPDYSKLFLQSTKQNPEKIFMIPRSIENNVILNGWFVINGLPRNAGGYAADTPSWDLLASYLCTDGLPIDQSPLFDPHQPFKNRDPRCTMTIVEFGTEHCGFVYNPSPYATTVMNYSTGKEQANQDTRAVNQYASFNGLIWKKGIDVSWTENGNKVDRDFLIMRYADVLLMYAEAKIELDQIDASVIDAINSVRARAYSVDKSNIDRYPAVTVEPQANMRKIVRMERRMELANEGLRYMDLIRWGLASKALNGYNYINLYPVTDLKKNVVDKGLWFWGITPKIDENGLPDFSPLFNAGLAAYGAKRQFPERQLLWPIPTHDLEVSPNLRNNPGY